MKKRLFVILLSLAVMVGLSFTVWAADGVVAKIGNQEYTSLGNAVAHVPTDGTKTTIVLTNDITGLTTDQIVTIAEGQNIVLDMAGHSITVDSAFTGRPIVNNGTLLVTGNGTISSEASELGGYGAILNNETGTLTIENGTFAGNVFGNGSAIRNLGDCVIHDGDFTGTAAVYNAETGDLTINDGNFHTTSCNQTINSAGQACWSYCISSAGNLVFNNGTVTGVQGALAIAGGTGVVYDGEFTTVACEHSESGATAFYAIYIAGETGNATASIYGGTYTAVSKAAIMVGNDNQGGDGGINAPASVVVYGGDFNSQEDVNVMLTGPSTGNPVISGGTFSNNIVGCQGQNNVTVSDYISSGSKISKDADGNQVVSVDEEKAIFEVNGVPYATLGDAVAAVPADGTQTTITLLKNAAGGGVQIKAGQNIIFDFGGYTYTVGAPTVGSAGTETNGFQLLNGSTVTMKNGTVKASDYEKLKILIQNYCDLTLEDIVLDAREAAQVQYVSSNNHGDVLITGNTSIYAAEGQKAFDVYYWPNGGYGEGVSVTVNTTGTIEGDIEYGSDGSDTGKNNIAQSASLEIKNGTIKGEISTSNLNENNDTAISVTGGTFDNTTWSDYTPAGNTLVDDGNGNYVVGIDETTAIAEVNGVGYPTIEDAIASLDGEDGTVTLLQSTSEDVVIASGNITLNLNGCTLTNVSSDTITVKIGATLTINGTGTVDNKSNGRAAIFNEGTVILNGGTYDRTSETGESADVSGGNSWYTICNHGTMTIGESVTVKNTGSFSSMIENGYFSYTGTNSRNSYVEGVNAANPSLTINGGEFIGGLNSVKNDDGGILEINGGSYTNTTQAAVLNWNVATITDGTFACTAANCILNGASTMTPSANDQGKLTITGGSFTSTGAPIANYFTTSEYIEVTGGTFSGEFPAEFCPEGNKPVPDGNGNYVIGVDEATAIAEVDDVGYMNVQDAIDAIDTEGTVTLLGNYTGTFTVPAGKTVTLDLNGKTLTHSGKDITVLGELVIEDSAGSGKLTSQGSIVVDGDTAKFTLESGALEFTNNYGIYCMNGATAIVNGGSIDSYYAPLSGNNTTGNMNFEINGGTLTAECGPAIYMPGQGTLTITGGVLNGGISLRMGQVNISGGTINAITDNIDSPAEYYNYSGNAWFPDALYVIGGTYTSNDATNGNSFVLNITGGEFICNNGQGSAVAIYDLARTGQEANVDISGNAVLTTNSTTRLAYQVLTLADIGVETPDAGYGNAELVGKVDTEISGGTFSTEIPEEYLADGVEFDIDENGNYVIKTVVEISFVDGTTGKTFTGLATSLLVGDKIAEPAGTVKPGYTVEGWYTDAALTEEWDFENDVIPDTETTLTLYAKFVPVQTAFEYPCSEDSITLDSGITAPKGYTYEFLWKDAKGAEIGTEASAQLKMPGAGSSAVYTLTVTATAQGGEVSTYTIVYTFSQDDHFGGKATCTHAARCSVCGERYGELDPDNHAYASEVRNAVAATMDREGYTGDTYCKGCGVMIKAGTIVPRLDHEHAFTRTDAKAATCTEDGNIEYYTCSVCGKIYEDAAGTIEISLADTVLPATGHSYGTEYEHNSAEHWHECATCGDRIDVGAHTFGEWTVTEEATATEDGSRERTCSVCGATETEVIPATGSGEETTAPTDTTEEVTSNTGTIILWVVIAVVVVAAAAIIIVYVVKKKKGGDGSNGGNPNGSKPTGSGNSAQSASSPKSGSSGN